MRVKFEFIDGTAEVYDANKINIVTEWFAGECTLERQIDQALRKGGIFEVLSSPKHSLIKKIKINSHTVKRITLIEDKAGA